MIQYPLLISSAWSPSFIGWDTQKHPKKIRKLFIINNLRIGIKKVSKTGGMRHWLNVEFGTQFFLDTSHETLLRFTMRRAEAQKW
jgi:hypothetical protein